MSLMDVTSQSLSRDLSKEVPDFYVVIAKHQVLGMADDAIREVIGCDADELSEVLNDPLYREVRLLVGAAHSQATVEQSTSWDKLEEFALSNLSKRIEHERDPEFLLKVAAVANKAQRRTQQGKEHGVLDPSVRPTKRITLTSRFVQSFDRHGNETRAIEKQVSIADGTAKNPTFDDVDALLGVSATPALPRHVEISTATPMIPTVDELDKFAQEREAGG